MREALRPFADVATHDIGEDEDDADIFRPMTDHNRAAKIRVGDMRRALAALSPEPMAISGSAVDEGMITRKGIYIASKTIHADRWRKLRLMGYPINSTWIDEAGAGESKDLADLWRRCVAEASSAEVLVLYRQPSETLKGGWVELGAALASGVPVFAVGIEEYTIANDKRIRHFKSMADAMSVLKPMINGIPFAGLTPKHEEGVK